MDEERQHVGKVGDRSISTCLLNQTLSGFTYGPVLGAVIMATQSLIDFLLVG